MEAKIPPFSLANRRGSDRDRFLELRERCINVVTVQDPGMLPHVRLKVVVTATSLIRYRIGSP